MYTDQVVLSGGSCNNGLYLLQSPQYIVQKKVLMMGHCKRGERREKERKERKERDKLLFYFLWPAHSAMGGSRNLFHKDWFHNAIGGPYKCYGGYKDHFLHTLLVPDAQMHATNQTEVACDWPDSIEPGSLVLARLDTSTHPGQSCPYSSVVARFRWKPSMG